MGPRKGIVQRKSFHPTQFQQLPSEHFSSDSLCGSIQKLDQTIVQQRRILLPHTIQKTISPIRLPPLWKESSIRRPQSIRRISIRSLEGIKCGNQLFKKNDPCLSGEACCL